MAALYPTFGLVSFALSVVLAVVHLRIGYGCFFKWLNVSGTIVWQLAWGFIGQIMAAVQVDAGETALPYPLYLQLGGLMVSAVAALIRRSNAEHQINREAAYAADFQRRVEHYYRNPGDRP